MTDILSLCLRSLVVLTGTLFVFDVPARYLGLSVWQEQIGLIMLGLVTADIFTVITPRRHNRRKQSLPAAPADIVIAGVSLALFCYAAWRYEELIAYGYLDNIEALIVSTAAVGLVCEATRRTAGWPLLVLLAAFFLYAVSAEHFSGMLQGRDVSLYEIFNYVVLDPSGLLGIPMAVVTTTVLAFIVFGAALFTLGGGRMFLDVAISSMRGIRGGTGKSSVLASSLFGSISGSAVGNVVTTGIVTIPLMKKTGYTAREAGAIEAVASTGGQLMPPIMGSAAFIMADIVSVPYQDIVKAALIPGILFYLTLFLQIHFRALRRNIRPLDDAEVPPVRATMSRYWPFLVPIALLLYLLFNSNLPPQKSAFISAAACIAAAFFTPMRPRPGSIMEIIDTAGTGMLSIIPAVAIAGIIIGILSITGLGFSFGLGVVEQSGDSLVVLLGLTALAALVLGMGLPTTAVYILMASLVAPALVQAGVPEIPAHLFVLYFGVLSMITPPICFASMAAASIAGSDFMQTGYDSLKFGISGFCVPFLFVAFPALLSLDVLDLNYWLRLVCVVAGFILLAAAVEGYFSTELRMPERWLLLVLVLLLFASLAQPVAGLILLGVSAAAMFWRSRVAARTTRA